MELFPTSMLMPVFVAGKLETLELSDTDLDLDMVFQALSGNEELSQRRLQSVNFTGNKVPPSAGTVPYISDATQCAHMPCCSLRQYFVSRS